ncbi:MAG: hypothetical protein K2I06_06885 [Ruminococcus sp.]|nr:hypothetical protein [Ruminococcus sp.]
MSRKKPKSRIRKWSENVVKKVIKTPFSMTANTAKNAVSKANPFDQKINKDDVADTGTESMRLAYTSVKKGKNAIKTVKRSVKTTERTIKTTGTVVKGTGTVVYRTTAFTIKSAILVSKFIVNTTFHVVASLMNPVVFIFVGFVVIFLLCFGASLMIISGDNTDKSARVNAAGLVNVSSQYQVGLEYLNTALENHQNNFNSLIDSLYFNYDDLTHSTLIYMERTDATGGKAVYEKSFATDERKNAIKSEWNISITEREFLAIAYVYLENEMNTSGNTEHGIYAVSYTQEVFDTIVSKCSVYSDSVYGGQKCPDENCTRHVEYIDNPDYQAAVERTNKSWAACEEWADIANSIIEDDSIIADGWRIDNWISVYNISPYYSNNGWDFYDYLYDRYIDNWNVMVSTPEKIEEVTYICEYQHDLHSIGLAFFDKETVMNALDFDDISKQWVELTEKGFENNPDIS